MAAASGSVGDGGVSAKVAVDGRAKRRPRARLGRHWRYICLGSGSGVWEREGALRCGRAVVDNGRAGLLVALECDDLSLLLADHVEEAVLEIS